MAQIKLQQLKHSYSAKPETAEDYALQEINAVWEDGGSYALLGPSGCGKTTLLNIISGLLAPSEGQVLFDGKDVTRVDTSERNIAQVFQFPVVYDTMTVFDNLAFPLRNRGFAEPEILQRVNEIAQMLELEDSLKKRAARLTADGKQKISLGRGLVRKNVNAILFDEPLTVIDPHLKWKLRSKLKELHQRLGLTMIYVTHDQTEAMTFAEQVVVMHDGLVVQTGTPVELFEHPRHTFVGHFIGSPGMNILPAQNNNGEIGFEGVQIKTSSGAISNNIQGKLEIGVRPEFIRFDTNNEKHSIPVEITKVSDLGKFRIVEVKHKQHLIKLILPEQESIPSTSPRIIFDPAKTRLYADSWVVS
ncbi:MAG: ABC transporter ATP-binding protein [Gammaproteobacteria bacterium]|nr:ABC transporter ATP-binding protein [Gammaproteobacteria bacterium]